MMKPITVQSISSVYILPSGTRWVTVTGRITNKRGLKEGLNPWVAGLFIKCMNSTGHKHKHYLTLLLDLKEKRKYSEVLTDCSASLVPWQFQQQSIFGKDSRFPVLWSSLALQSPLCSDTTGRALPSDAPSAKTVLGTRSLTRRIRASSTLRKPRRTTKKLILYIFEYV